MELQILSDPPSEEIRARYNRDGFVFPLRAIPKPEADAACQRFESMMRDDERVEAYSREYANLVFTLVDQLSHDDRLLDLVEVLLGPDLLLWGAGFVIKPPASDKHISWHQDLTYWGLDGTDEVAVWLALSPATLQNGCMRFMPGSHRDGIVEHKDTFAHSNILSRGQEIVADIDEDKAAQVILEAGQVSLHHGRLFHASASNRTDRWRIGLAMQYIKPSMSQTVGRRDFAQLVRGEDRFGHFEMLPRPKVDFDVEGLAAYAAIETSRNEAYYDGAHEDGWTKTVTQRMSG